MGYGIRGLGWIGGERRLWMGLFLSGGFGGYGRSEGLFLVWCYQGLKVSTIDISMDVPSQLCLHHAVSTVLAAIILQFACRADHEVAPGAFDRLRWSLDAN